MVQLSVIVSMIVTLGAGSSTPLATNTDQFEALVTAVFSGSAVKLKTDSEEVLVALYGIKCDESNSAKDRANSFIKSRTDDTKVIVRPISNIAGLLYVEIVLPSELILNEEMLKQGFALLDGLSAGQNENYKNLAAAGAALIESQTDQQESKKAAANREEMEKALAQFKLQKNLKSIASFEAEVEKWRSLPEEYREAIRNHYRIAFGSRAQQNTNIAAQRESVKADALEDLDATRRRIRREQSAIALQNAQEQADLEEVYDDSRLKWNASMLESLQDSYEAEVATGHDYSAAITGHLIEEYDYKTAKHQARVEETAEQVAIAHERVRQERVNKVKGLQIQQQQVLGDVQKADAMQRAADRMVASNILASTGELQRIAALDDAVNSEFQPILHLWRISQTKDDSNLSHIPFTANSAVWRIDWYFAGIGPDLLTLEVYSADTNKLVGRMNSDCPPQKAYFIGEGAGKYRLEISTAGNSQFLIDIFEVQTP